MRAAWYERQGSAEDVLVVGEMPDPAPGPGEVRVRLAVSGVSPGDVKKRGDVFGVGMPFPRVVPHSDGAGTVDAVGEGVDTGRIGARVWVHGAQSYRPGGTAAEACVVPEANAVPLPESVSFEQGACLGIPGITAHRCVAVAGPLDGKAVLVQGGAGAVSAVAIRLSRRGGARVVATVRREADRAIAEEAGAHEVVVGTGGLDPESVDHVVESAFAAHVQDDERVLRVHGTIAAYATDPGELRLPFWPLLFKNVTVFFLGSDDFTSEAKAAAARDLTDAASEGWVGLPVAARFGLEEIAEAHRSVETRAGRGRVLLTL